MAATLLFTGGRALFVEAAGPEDAAAPLVARGLTFRNEVFVATGGLVM